MNKKNTLTPYIEAILAAKMYDLPIDMREQMEKEAHIMSSLGVSTEDDHKQFMYIVLHVKKIAKDILGEALNQESLAELSNKVYENRNKYPIDTIFNFYKAVDNGLKSIGMFKKKAYPTGQSGSNMVYPRDVGKWINTMKELYSMVHNGVEFKVGLNHLTKEWDVMAKIDFENWLSFYQEGAHEKYKIANEYYFDDDGAPRIPISHLRSKLPTAPPGMPNMEQYLAKKEIEEEDKQAAADAEAERREEVDKKIKSLDSRFRSALKLLSNEDVLDALDGKIDMPLSDFMEQIQALQRHILLRPLKNKKSSLLEDLIIQRGNQLEAIGFPKTATLIRSFALAPSPTPVDELKPSGNLLKELEGEEPPGDALPEDTLPGNAPPEDAPPENVIPPLVDESFEEEEGREWVGSFKKLLNPSDSFKTDDSETDDSETDDLAFITVAQDMPLEPPEPRPDEDVAIEVEDEPQKQIHDYSPGMDSLENVTIEGVINRLERVANILKNREIPRELAWIDLELDRLNLASYFPGLAEAHKSSLESNQYMSTRIDEIVSRLRGSVATIEPIELVEEDDQVNDTIKSIRNNLENQEKKEKKEKAAPTPLGKMPAPMPAPMVQELSKPIDIQKAPPRPIR